MIFDHIASIVYKEEQLTPDSIMTWMPFLRNLFLMEDRCFLQQKISSDLGMKGCDLPLLGRPVFSRASVLVYCVVHFNDGIGLIFVNKIEYNIFR